MRLTNRDINGVFKALSYFPMSAFELAIYLNKTEFQFKLQINEPLYNINKRLFELYREWYLNRFKNPNNIYTYYLVKRTTKEHLAELATIPSTNRLFRPIALWEREHYQMTLNLFINLKQNFNYFSDEFKLLDIYWDRQFRLYYQSSLLDSKKSLIEPDLTLLIEKESKKFLLFFEVERKRKDPFKIKWDFKSAVHRKDLESLKNKYARYQDLSELFKTKNRPPLISYLEKKYEIINSFVPVFITTNRWWESVYSDFFKNEYKWRYRVSSIDRFKSIITKDCNVQVSNTLTKEIYFKLWKKAYMFDK